MYFFKLLEILPDRCPLGHRCQDFLNFFFSSRRRHTRSLFDWSSDVCSSDLVLPAPLKPVSQSVGGAVIAYVGCGIVCPCSMCSLQYSKALQKNLSSPPICTPVCTRSYWVMLGQAMPA